MGDDPNSPTYKLGKHGGHRVPGQARADQGDSGTLRSRGHSRAYILARLAREGRLDWIAAIESKRVSAYTAAVELGWTKRAPTLRGEHGHQAKRRRFQVRALIG